MENVRGEGIGEWVGFLRLGAGIFSSHEENGLYPRGKEKLSYASLRIDRIHHSTECIAPSSNWRGWHPAGKTSNCHFCCHADHTYTGSQAGVAAKLSHTRRRG